MGVITISMDNEHEKMLRDMAKEKYGDKKDAISKTIIDAIEEKENRKEQAISRLKQRLENPLNINKNKKVRK